VILLSFAADGRSSEQSNSQSIGQSNSQSNDQLKVQQDLTADGRSNVQSNNQLKDQQDRAVAALRHLPQVHDLTPVDEGVTAIAPDGGAAIPQVLAALTAAGLSVARLSLTSPTLDDVFLRHTGRSIRQEELNPNWRSSRGPWGGGRGPWGGRRRRP
jgi:hypothetical protein